MADIPNTQSTPPHSERVALKRALSLPLLILYGVGVTVGAGIYVLVGATAGRAGIYAPVSFLLAALVMAPTAVSFAELAGRYPVSAGEAAYVRAAFKWNPLATTVGLLVVMAGVVSSAAISVGSAGYIRQFVDLPTGILAPTVIIVMSLVAIWGITQSVLLAGLFTVIEVAGLVVIVVAGLTNDPEIFSRFPELVPEFSADSLVSVWPGITAGVILAFFAFIGFEDLVNVAEEAHDPERTMPRAIFATLAVTVLLYFLVTAVAVLTVAPAELAVAEAPLGLVFERATGTGPHILSGIAVIAILNTLIVQIVMASRVIYGVAVQGGLPSFLAKVNPLTRTPVYATVVVAAIIIALASLFDLERLADSTSRITLVIFVLINASLIRIKLAGTPPPPNSFHAPFAAPLIGVVASAVLLVFSG